MGPTDFLQLAGHPIRWQLLESLASSDRSVGELTDIVGKPQNLVSYHLAKLRSAGLVRSRRSSFDARDSYYTADLTAFGEHLAATAAAIHPGLGSPPPDDGGTTASSRVLFLCTGNSARSQIAEALARHRSGGAVVALSAGSRPKPLHPHFATVMHERGIDVSGHRPTPLSELVDQQFDRVVTLCDKVREVCPEFPGAPVTTHWSIPDPAADTDRDDLLPAFRSVADDLDIRVGFLLAALDLPAHR